MDELMMLLSGEYMQSKIEPKIIAKVPHSQLEVRASHILVANTNHALALKLLKEVKAGANFAALAHKYSIDTASAAKGGDLGYFPRGTMVAPFDNAAFSMRIGEVRLVHSQFGWHIIKVTGREVKKLSASAYQNAQQSAYSKWIDAQKNALHVQNIVAPASLPNIATPAPTTAPVIPTVSLPTIAPVTPAPTHAVPHPTTSSGKK
jgi:hypothetical protein